MTSNDQSKVGNEFLIQNSIKSGITFACIMHVILKTAKDRIFIMAGGAAAVFDLAVTSLLAGRRKSTLVIFHVEYPIPIDKMQ